MLCLNCVYVYVGVIDCVYVCVCFCVLVIFIIQRFLEVMSGRDVLSDLEAFAALCVGYRGEYDGEVWGMVVRLEGVRVLVEGDLAVVFRCVGSAVDVVPLTLYPGGRRRWFRVSRCDVTVISAWGGSFPELLPHGYLRWGVFGSSGRSLQRSGMADFHYRAGWNSTFVEWGELEVGVRPEGDVSGEAFRVRCYRGMMCLLCRGDRLGGGVPVAQELGCIGRLFVVAARYGGFDGWVPYFESLMGWLFELEGMYAGWDGLGSVGGGDGGGVGS